MSFQTDSESFYYNYEKRATARVSKKVKYDDGHYFEERWDLLDDDEQVDGYSYTGGWKYIYREWDKNDTLVRHWYIDDIPSSLPHYIDVTDSSDEQFPDQPLPDDDGDDSSHLASTLATKALHASWA